MLADRERLLGDEHPATLTARANLANSYSQAGRTTDAITLEERVLEAGCEDATARLERPVTDVPCRPLERAPAARDRRDRRLTARIGVLRRGHERFAPPARASRRDSPATVGRRGCFDRSITALKLPEPPLSDGVIALRGFEPCDIDRLVEICQDPHISRWTLVPSDEVIVDPHVVDGHRKAYDKAGATVSRREGFANSEVRAGPFHVPLG